MNPGDYLRFPSHLYHFGAKADIGCKRRLLIWYSTKVAKRTIPSINVLLNPLGILNTLNCLFSFLSLSFFPFLFSFLFFFLFLFLIVFQLSSTLLPISLLFLFSLASIPEYESTFSRIWLLHQECRPWVVEGETDPKKWYDELVQQHVKELNMIRDQLVAENVLDIKSPYLRLARAKKKVSA